MRDELRPEKSDEGRFGSSFVSVCREASLDAEKTKGYREAIGCPKQFANVVQKACDAIQEAKGGCGIVVAPSVALDRLKKDHSVRFAPVDRDDKFPIGYMNTRVRGLPVDSENFLRALREFTEHSATDRWPKDHEAKDLPKDGYIIVDSAGRCLEAAVRIEGLRSPKLGWRGHGTRHLAALALIEMLEKEPAAVLVRSDRGTLHGLTACNGGEVKAIVSLVEQEVPGPSKVGSTVPLMALLVIAALCTRWAALGSADR